MVMQSIMTLKRYQERVCILGLSYSFVRRTLLLSADFVPVEIKSASP